LILFAEVNLVPFVELHFVLNPLTHLFITEGNLFV
jgi:hypothetical protein